MLTELWVLRGDRPVLWALPYRVTHEGSQVRLRAAISLREKEEKAAAAVLRELGEREGEEWTMSFFQLRRVAEQVPDEQPEQHAIWHRPHVRQTKPWSRAFGQAAIEDFTDGLFLAGVGQSREEVATWWYHFRNHMLDWLINKERTVDLGFVKLHQSARRLNWIQTTHKCGARIIVPRERRSKLLRDDPKFNERVSGRSVIEVRGDGTAFRFIEVEHGRTWDRLTKRVEAQRLKLLKPVAYAKHTLAGLARGKAAAAALFAFFSERSEMPSALLQPCRPNGPVVLSPPGANGRMPAKKRRFILRAREMFLEKMRRGRSAKRAPPRVRELRVVQPACGDMRDGNGNGTGGLSVSLPNQGGVAPSQLLEVGEGRS